jgi:Tubulin-tyrosine ligase family
MRTGVDFEPVLDQMKEYIIRLLHHFQPHLVRSAMSYPVGPTGFFTMFRFDFILDPQLHPWLIEVNQSPNLSSDVNVDLQNMFQRISWSLLSLNGYGQGQLRYPLNAEGQQDITAHHNDVDIGWCVCSRCEDTCAGDCVMCRRCRAPEQTRMLRVRTQADMHAEAAPNTCMLRLRSGAALTAVILALGAHCSAWFDLALCMGVGLAAAPRAVSAAQASSARRACSMVPKYLKEPPQLLAEHALRCRSSFRSIGTARASSACSRPTSTWLRDLQSRNSLR